MGKQDAGRIALCDLAQFTIHSIKAGPNGYTSLRRHFNHLVGVRYWRNLREWRGYLYRSRSDSVWGRIPRIDRKTKSAVMLASPAPKKLRVGQTLPYVDYEWDPAQVARALEPATLWRKTVLKPVDAARYQDPKVPGWWTSHVATRLPAEGATNVHVIKKGWDVEYCNFCRARIGRKGLPFGYSSKPENQWLCEPCYKNYVARHDLRFLQFK